MKTNKPRNEDPKSSIFRTNPETKKSGFHFFRFFLVWYRELAIVYVIRIEFECLIFPSVRFWQIIGDLIHISRVLCENLSLARFSCSFDFWAQVDHEVICFESILIANHPYFFNVIPRSCLNVILKKFIGCMCFTLDIIFSIQSHSILIYT